MFEIASFKTEFRKLRSKYFGLDMCLTSRSLASRLVPLFLVKIVCIQSNLRQHFCKA